MNSYWGLHWKLNSPGAHSPGTAGRWGWSRCSGCPASERRGGWTCDRTTATPSPPAAGNHPRFCSRGHTTAAPGRPPAHRDELHLNCSSSPRATNKPHSLFLSLTCVVTSQPSSRLTMTDEPVSKSSTTSTDTCSTLCSWIHKVTITSWNNYSKLVNLIKRSRTWGICWGKLSQSWFCVGQHWLTVAEMDVHPLSFLNIEMVRYFANRQADSRQQVVTL